MFENPEALNRIKSMYSFATAVAKNHQILMLTSNDNRTTNISDYTGNSVKAEFFSDEDEALISNQNIYITDISTNPHYTLHSSYFYVFQQLGLNYEDLIACLIASSLMNNTRNKK